jgi:predicted flap endonuclease-1-like 5' DNA nuclease
MATVPTDSPVRANADDALLPAAEARAQQMRALGNANHVRTARATLKNDLARGRVRIEDVLNQPPAFATAAKVSDLLLAIPGVGPVRATRALIRCQIPHTKTVAALTARQRLALLALLPLTT